MDAEEFLDLFDSYWFVQQIFTKKSLPPSDSSPLKNPPLKIEIESPKPEISRLPSRHVRSLSDEFISSKISSVPESESPNSVLFSHKLQKILSGKQSSYGEDEEESTVAYKKEEEEIKAPISSKKSSMFMKGSKRRNRGSSKSLSELEFDELKGFMDLGFVFSEEDKSSSTLVSIIPGLQRLRKNGGNDVKSCSIEIVDHKKGGLISRPYLSEAWKSLDQEKFTYPYPPLMIMNWKVPALRDGIDMKDQIKCWAHSVASTVR